MRKWLIRISVALAILLPPAVVFRAVPFQEPGRFTEKQFQHLREGMTRNQVEAILGVPAGDYMGGKGDFRHFENGESWTDGTGVPKDLTDRWCGDDGAIILGFDEDGKMVERRLLACVAHRTASADLVGAHQGLAVLWQLSER